MEYIRNTIKKYYHFLYDGQATIYVKQKNLQMQEKIRKIRKAIKSEKVLVKII